MQNGAGALRGGGIVSGLSGNLLSLSLSPPFPLLKTASSSIAGLHFLSGFSLLQRNGLRTRVPIPNNRSSLLSHSARYVGGGFRPIFSPLPLTLSHLLHLTLWRPRNLKVATPPSLLSLPDLSPPLPPSLHHMRSTIWSQISLHFLVN